MDVLLLPLGLYSAWQLTYWFITECLLRQQLESDPSLITSLRYLANDKKNAFRNLNIKLLLWLGVAEPGEELVADAAKTKVIFAMIQFLYTLVTIIPTYFLFDSYILSCIFLTFMLSCGTWNGASYYIEVFAERYRLQFQSTEDTEEAKDDSVEDSDEDNENFQNALEELDQTSDLYKEIVAAIIEDSSTDGLGVERVKSTEPSVGEVSIEDPNESGNKEDSE